MNAFIPVQDRDISRAIRDLLHQIIEKDLADCLYVPLDIEGGGPVPALVTDPEKLERANPLAPVMPINGARAVSKLTGKHSPLRLGAVLRPCEIRALIELVKLQQASLEKVLLIGIDCPGTYELRVYSKQNANGGFPLMDYLASAEKGDEPSIPGMSLRSACLQCVHPVPENVDIHVHLFGADLTHGIPLTVKDEIADRLEPEEMSEVDPGRCPSAIDAVVAHRSQNREGELSAVQTNMTSNGGIADYFSDCIRCHNCMTACPICYCKNCLFRTSAFDHDPIHYVTAARHKGAARLLGDSLLFQLTRLHHMSASCVGCGMCTSACPVDIPVGTIFSAVGRQVQDLFDYLPGRDMNEPLPLVTFQPDEWTEEGEGN